MGELRRLHGEVLATMAAYQEPMAERSIREHRGHYRQKDRLVDVAEFCVAHFRGDILEIGAAAGETTRLFAEIAAHYGRRVLVVDPWEVQSWRYEVFQELTVPYRSVIDVVKASSFGETGSAAIRERDLCFTYVDGLHEHDACYSDIVNAAHTAGAIAVDDIFYLIGLAKAFYEASTELGRIAVARISPPMREGYLLPTYEGGQP